MVTKQVIKNLYKKYNHAPESVDCLDVATLFSWAAENHGLIIDEDKLYIGSVDPASPFAEIPLKKINAIVEFDNVVAIILPSAIIFLEKYSDGVNVHLKLEGPSLWERVKTSMQERASRHTAQGANYEQATAMAMGA